MIAINRVRVVGEARRRGGRSLLSQLREIRHSYPDWRAITEEFLASLQKVLLDILEEDLYFKFCCTPPASVGLKAAPLRPSFAAIPTSEPLSCHPNRIQ
jgi:hypothetical protein